jgi:hypothetical protein
MTALQVRKAQPRDAPAMTSISQAAYAPFVPLIGRPPAPMLADHASRIANDTVFVACGDGGVVLGYAIVIETGRHRVDGFDRVYFEKYLVPQPANG